MRTRAILASLCVCLLWRGLRAETDAEKKARDALRWLSLSPEQKSPSGFEPFLMYMPGDQAYRTAALVWYSRRGKSFELLRHHTFAMIEHHPANSHIFFANVSEFYAMPEYHSDVVRRLEKRLERTPSSGGYWVLASVCERRALPCVGRSKEQHERFLSYYGLPEDAQLPQKTDDVLVAKTIRYFRRAIGLLGDDRYGRVFYSQQLIEFLSSLGRHDEAIEVCKSLVGDEHALSDTGFLLAYGNALRAAGRSEEAKIWLRRVRADDHEGFEKGPGCSTVRAETALGLIAVDQGRIAEAERHLLASVDVQPCCHNITIGLPTELAGRLLRQGRTAAVRRYCETVLKEFTPGRPVFEALLKRVAAAEIASR